MLIADKKLSQRLQASSKTPAACGSLFAST